MFITLSKIFQIIFEPGNFLLLLLMTGTALLWTNSNIWGRRIVSLTTILLFIIAAFPVGQILSIPLEEIFPVPESLPEKVTGIITTGGVNPYIAQMTGRPSLEDGAESLTTAVWLARKYPEAKLLFTGGSSSMLYGNYSEASAACLFFRQQGIEENRLFFDTDSRGTQEKAVNCFNLVKPMASETWVLITSAVRMPRTFLVFQNAGWQVIPYPVDFHSSDYQILKFDLDHSLIRLWSPIKEWIGLAAYRVTGRTSVFLPK